MNPFKKSLSSKKINKKNTFVGYDEKQAGGSLKRIKSEGFLTKEGGKVRTWRRRLFRLEGNEIKYFSDKKEKGSFKLETGTIVANAKGYKGRECCFKIITPFRTYFLQAASKKELINWVRDLSRVSGVITDRHFERELQKEKDNSRRNTDEGVIKRSKETKSTTKYPLTERKPKSSPEHKTRIPLDTDSDSSSTDVVIGRAARPRSSATSVSRNPELSTCMLQIKHLKRQNMTLNGEVDGLRQEVRDLSDKLNYLYNVIMDGDSCSEDDESMVGSFVVPPSCLHTN